MRKDIEDIIYFAMNNYDHSPVGRKMAKEIAGDILAYLKRQEPYEGIIRNGDFFLRRKDGTYYSMNSHKTLKD